jgi:ubiquinone/menaquinone biosynthesis C-methylase UbiE
MDVREVVERRYGEVAKEVLEGGRGSCCGGAPCGGAAPEKDPVSRDLYSAEEAAALPEKAVLASQGCGNPTALAELRPGEVVLDLGSGGGIDVLLSARRVGPTGKAYGLDMTAEMLELARRNQREAGVPNAEFLQGTIEDIPLPDASVDVLISNCVINLSGDKDRVLREAFRVLKPGGRFAVSDVVLKRPLPEPIQRSIELWVGCVAGALTEHEYEEKLGAAGFTEISLQPTRVYRADDAREMARAYGVDAAVLEPYLEEVDGAVLSAFVRARKP